MSRSIRDFHSHILPNMDDGSGSVEESLAMLRMEAEQGIRHVIATPHFYPHEDTPDRFLRRRAEAGALLRRAMSEQQGLPVLDFGAEVYYFPGMSDSEMLSRLTIGEKGCILIEMPLSSWTPQMYRELEWIYTKQNLIPVIAHLDRYIRPLGSREILRRLEALPVLVQANAGFFLRRGTAAFAMKLLQERRIHILGSDCHNLTDRAPNLGAAVQAIEWRLGSEALLWIREQEEELLSRLSVG